jgi:hypothetical protein
MREDAAPKTEKSLEDVLREIEAVKSKRNPGRNRKEKRDWERKHK